MIINPERWSQDAHVLFIDSPVGAGFSFTEEESGYPTDDDMVATHLVEAIIQVRLFYLSHEVVQHHPCLACADK